MAGERSQWAWYLSSLLYRWSSTAASDQADEDLIGYLGRRLEEAVVIDCGAGPGLLGAKLLDRGPRLVVAVDANPRMVRQAEARLRPAIRQGRAQVVSALIDGRFFEELACRPDIIVFKRSLYCTDDRARETLGMAVRATGRNGIVAVVHPETSLGRYAFGCPRRLRRHTAFHLFNRFISVIAAALGTSGYRTHSADGLHNLLRSAAGGAAVSRVRSEQHAYNIAVILPNDRER